MTVARSVRAPPPGFPGETSPAHGLITLLVAPSLHALQDTELHCDACMHKLISSLSVI